MRIVCITCYELRAVYMGGGTGLLLGRDVKGDLAMHVYISYLSHSVYMERILSGRFSCRPGKAGSWFAQPGSRLKRDNFYHINTPSRFAGTILCLLCKLSPVKSSRVETFPCKPGMKSVPSRKMSVPPPYKPFLKPG